MPTYDYRCRACGHEMETFQSIREGALKKCPKCGKSKLERLIGPGAGILFKGGGFYQTDYRSENYKQGASAEKGESKPVSETAPSKSSESSSGQAGAAKSGEGATAKPEVAKETKAPKPRKKSD